MGLLMIMNAVLIHKIMTETGQSLFVDTMISSTLMSQICFVLLFDTLFCFAAAVFLCHVGLEIRKEHRKRVDMDRQQHFGR